MDPELVREKLRLIVRLTAEIQAMLPDEPSRPYLVLVKDGDYDIGDDLSNVAKPSCAREGFPILWGKQSEKKALEGKKQGKKTTQTLSKQASSKFQKEISKMPKKLQEKIKRAVLKEPRYHNRVYEKRVFINGNVIFACSQNVEECQIKFMEQLSKFLSIQRDENGNTHEFRTTTAGVLFSEFAERWFENIHKNKVIETTYYSDHTTFWKHVIPVFGDRRLRSITSADCIDFISSLLATGHERMTEQCDGLLRQVFDYAVNSELIPKNPLAAFKRVKGERENGVPLTKEEERELLKALEGTKYELRYVVALYTGVRPCEISSIKINGEFIVAQNRKQKNQKRIVFKKIPITPMLQPYLPKLREALQNWEELMSRSDTFYRNEFRRRCPGNEHTPYDLRTTFATRCQECGASEQAVQAWMGHAPNSILAKVYTKLSDEYLLSEGKKVKY